jgi:hypothetical protein
MYINKLIVGILLLASTNSFGQITKGTNFISMGNTVFNKPFTKFDQYPDTTITDSTGTNGLSATFMINYHVAVSKHFTIGIKTRVLTNKESTYGISSFGPAVRYYFGFGQDEPKAKYMKKGDKYSSTDLTTQARRFYNHESKERLKSLFFVEAGYMFGNLRYDSNKIKYSEMSLQAGALFRFPLPETQLLRHFGLELSAGVFGMSDEFEKLTFRPNLSAGLLIFLDRKYSSTKKIPRKVEYLD